MNIKAVRFGIERKILFILFLSSTSLSFAQAPKATSALEARIEFISKKFLGLTYGSSPLGEASGIDRDPLIRFDKFDCTTYVETVGALALSASSSQQEAISTLNQIRYSNGRPSFISRNHFVSLDWIPNNVKKGILEDVTESLFPSDTYQIHTIIDKGTWFEKNFNIKTSWSRAEASLNVISVSDLLDEVELLNRIPSGSVVNFVVHNPTIEQKIGTDLDVTHQGILVRVGGKLLLRHAKNPNAGVVEEVFQEYLVKASEKGLYAVNFNRFKEIKK